MFATTYRYLAGRRAAFLAMTAVAAVATLVAAARVRPHEDVEALLPDRDPGLRLDFQLLKRSPVARKLVIHLERQPDVSQAALLAAADRLAAALPAAYFQRVLTGPGAGFGGGFLTWLSGALPNLATPADLGDIAAGLAAPAVRDRLAADRQSLLAPEGLALKELVKADPLNYRELVFRKLAQLRLVPEARLEDGHFVSRDGRCTLIVAETGVALTDAAGAGELVAAFERATTTLPAGVTATLVAGHRYTVANAAALKRDLRLVLAASGLALAAVILLFLRHWRAVFVFLVPAWVVLFATVVVGAIEPAVSAITIGFGGVLLGIANDFSTYTYCALRARRGDAAEVVAQRTPPLAVCAVTMSGAFAVLLLSALPGQRQLGVFALAGPVAALAVSLLVLPHLIAPAPGAAASPPALVPAPARGRRGLVLGLWLGVLAASVACLPRLQVSGELRDLGVQVDELRAAEQRVAAAWGEVRGRALIFVTGRDAETALLANDRLYARLRQRLPDLPLASLAPVLPAAATQAANRARWRAYWDGGAAATVRALLAQEGPALGFAGGAFAAFADRLSQPAAACGPDALRAAGLGEVLDLLLSQDPDGVRVMTLAPDTPELATAVAAVAGEVPGVRLVSPTAFGKRVGAAVRADFRRFLIVAVVVVVVLLTVAFRGRLWRVGLALVPAATGVAFMLGVMAAAGWPLNLFNVVAGILVIGLGVDYGIFMLYRLTGETDSATERAVLVSALINLASFGALTLARHPALAAIGVSVGLGVLAAMAAALLVLPALWRVADA